MKQEQEKAKRGRKKGTTKTGGRKKGTPNKATASMKEWLTALIDNNRAQIERDLMELEPKERLTILERFMNYCLPKAQAVQIDYNNLNDEQLDEVIKELTQSIDDES